MPLPLYVPYPKGNYVLAKVKAFVEFLVAALREEVGAGALGAHAGKTKVSKLARTRSSA